MATGIPYSPTGFPGDFDVEENQLARQQALYEALQARGGVTGLGAALRGMLTGYDPGVEIQQRQQDLAKRRSAAAQDWLGRMPQDTPFKPGWNESVQAGDETGGPGFSNYTPGQEPTPAHTVTPQENLQWATQGFGLGSAPTKIAEAALLKATAGKSKDQYISTPYGIFNADKGKYEPANPLQEAELKSKQDERIDRLNEAARIAQQRSEDARYTADQRAESAREALQARKEIAGMIHSMTNQGSLSVAGTDAEGNTILLHNKGGLVNAQTGKPFTGQLVRASDEKNVSSATEALAGASTARQLAQQVLANKGHFGPQAGMGTQASAMTGGIIPLGMASGLDTAGIENRARLFNAMSEVTHKIFGSAYTTSEQKIGAPWLPQQSDNAEAIAAKLEAIAQRAEAKAREAGTKANTAATARSGGASGGWGKATPVP